MYLTHLLMVIDPCAKYDMTAKANRSFRSVMKTNQKPYKFDLEVKGQCRIRIMNVLDTSSNGDIAHVPNMVCQCQSKQKLLVGHKDMT